MPNLFECGLENFIEQVQRTKWGIRTRVRALNIKQMMQLLVISIRFVPT